jgi:hypothetical protein
MGIEPTSEAWEARNKNLKTLELAALNSFREALNWKMNGKQKNRSDALIQLLVCDDPACAQKEQSRRLKRANEIAVGRVVPRPQSVAPHSSLCLWRCDTLLAW